VLERFGSAGIPKEKISCVRDTYVFNYPGSTSEFVAAFRNYYGPTMNAFDAASKNGKGCRSSKGAGGIVRAEEHCREGQDFDSGDVPAGDSTGLI